MILHRSLYKGYNPNNDFDIKSTQKWLSYSDYNYWEGTLFFDSIGDLCDKIVTSNFTWARGKMEQHRIKNKMINKNNWQAIVSYLHDAVKNDLPTTFEEGIRQWEMKIDEPSFLSKIKFSRNNPSSIKWVIITSHTLNINIEYIEEKWNFLYVSNGSDKDHLQSIFKTVSKSKLEILTLEKQKVMNYKVTTYQDADNFTKDVLTGSIYVISHGATSIHILQDKSRGKIF